MEVAMLWHRSTRDTASTTAVRVSHLEWPASTTARRDAVAP